MPNRDESTNRDVSKRVDRRGAGARSAHEAAELRILSPSGYCAVCNLTFGSQEKRVPWGEKTAHPACVRRARRLEAA